MGDRTGIEWTAATWNPVRGCARVSPGCEHCYAEAIADRFSGPGQPWADGYIQLSKKGEPRWSGKVTFLPHTLDQPRRWKRPKRIFVNSMSDLFHREIADEQIQAIFTVMRECARHQFQILTKRPERLAKLTIDWPANVWMGVSIESADYLGRAELLRQCGAAIKFLSLEPLLGPLPKLDLTGIDWVIVGGESGPGARPMEADWVREIRDQVVRAGVHLHFKQWGGVRKKLTGRVLDDRTWDEYPDGSMDTTEAATETTPEILETVKASGRRHVDWPNPGDSPFANLSRMMSGVELIGLCMDIIKHGLREPIVLGADGLILDGRNRFRACCITGTEPQYVRLPPMSPDELVERVLSATARKHESSKDLSIRTALLCEGTPSGRPAKTRSADPVFTPWTLSVACARTGGKAGSTKRARRLLAVASPELLQAIRQSPELDLLPAVELGEKLRDRLSDQLTAAKMLGQGVGLKTIYTALGLTAQKDQQDQKGSDGPVDLADLIERDIERQTAGCEEDVEPITVPTPPMASYRRDIEAEYAGLNLPAHAIDTLTAAAYLEAQFSYIRAILPAVPAAKLRAMLLRALPE